MAKMHDYPRRYTRGRKMDNTIKTDIARTVRDLLEKTMPAEFYHQGNFYKISIRPTDGLDVGEFVVQTNAGPRHFSVRLKESY